MSKPPLIRSKRPLSPAFEDASTSNPRKTSRTIHAEDDQMIVDPTSNQDTPTIPESIPAASETRRGSIPFPPPIITQSRFFAREIKELAPFLLGRRWGGKHGCCKSIAHALEVPLGPMRAEVQSVIESSGDKWYKTLEALHGPAKSKELNYADGSRDDYLMDFCIAIMDMAMLISQRIPVANLRKLNSGDTRKPFWGYDSICLGCGSLYIGHSYPGGLLELGSLIACVVIGAWREDAKAGRWNGEWILALLHALPDGSTHSFRSAVSRYITLPSLLPPRGPNDPWVDDDPFAKLHAENLLDYLKSLPGLIRSESMLATDPSPIPGLDNLSVSDTRSPIESSKHN
jgi:hypothetical protein